MGGGGRVVGKFMTDKLSDKLGSLNRLKVRGYLIRVCDGLGS